MIGNNSCGATAQRAGKLVDNVAELEVLLYDGTRFWCLPCDYPPALTGPPAQSRPSCRTSPSPWRG